MHTLCRARNATQEARVIAVVGPEYWVSVRSLVAIGEQPDVYQFYTLAEALLKYMQIATKLNMKICAR